MKVTVKTTEDTTEQDMESLESILSGEGKMRLLSAGASAFATIAFNNFGYGEGGERPSQWPILSYAYAKEFHGGNRIPTLVLSGDLRSSIHTEVNQDSAVVIADADYAETHQFGDSGNNIPARPFFPMDEQGNATPIAEQEILAAIEGELERMLNG